jgi:hypothetical protein
VTFTGEINVQEIGLMKNVEISTSGEVTGKLKAEYDNKIIRIVDEVKVKPSTDWRTVDVACGFTVVSRLNGREFVNQSLEFTPPDKYKCSIQPTGIAGDLEGLEFEGNMGVEIEITTKGPKRPTAPIAAWITVGAISSLGTASVVPDIVKDAGSAGTLVPTSPIAWYAAMVLFRQAQHAAAMAP